MTWIRVEDDFPHHPDVWALPPTSAWLFVAALCYSRHYLTDGFIGEDVLELVCRGASRKHVVPLLASHWDETEGGWRIRNYDRYQQTKDEVERSREAGANRARRSRERKRDRGVPPSTEVEKELEVEKEQPPQSPPQTSLPVRANEFDDWWLEYPNKLGEPTARKRYLWHRGNGVAASDLLAGLREWVGYWQQRGEPQFIPKATKWLEEQAWKVTPPLLTNRADHNLDALRGAFADVIGERDDTRGSRRTDRPNDVDVAPPGLDTGTSLDVASRPAAT